MGPPEQYIQLLDASNGLRVAVVKVGFGQVSINGDLGYPEELTNSRVMLPQLLPTDTVISAHANSELRLTLPWPAEIYGAMNSSTKGYGGQCEFWIDHHWIGDLHIACDTTPVIRLHPGEYQLLATGVPNKHGKHALWGIRRIPKIPRLGLTTVGCYYEKDVKEALKWLHLTSAKQGMFLNVFGVGLAYQCHSLSKIIRLAEWLKQVPHDYLLFMDGRDSFLQGGEDEIVQGITEFDDNVIGAERCLWPIAAWESRFDQTDQRFPNSGLFAGTRQNVLDDVNSLVKVRADIMAGNVPDWIKSDNSSNLYDNDQAVWHAAMLLGRVKISIDHLSKLFINPTCLDTRFTGTDIKVANGRLTSRWGTSAPCVHFPGVGANRMEQWIGALGICRDIRKPSV